MIDASFEGAQVLRPSGLELGAVHVAGGRLVEARQERRVILPPGSLILPGIIDIHGDGFERHLAPRRGAMRDLGAGLLATEAELAANGITTAMLAQFWSWEGGMRSPEFCRAFLASLRQFRGMGTDMRAQLRVEIGLVEQDADRLLELVRAYDISQVVLNDHLPHDALAKGRRPPRLTGQALKSGRSPEAHLALIQELAARRANWPDALAAFAQELRASGVVVGSHDDRTFDDRASARSYGAALSEFPCTAVAAEAAFSAGEPVIMGAPNVVRGGSHDGNASATQFARMGWVSALASDYHYPAPRLAALALKSELGLQKAWGLISEGPARILGLSDRGQIAPGLRADLLITDAEFRPGLTMAGGEITYAAGPIAAALLN
ncbi:MAG TPA: alpha-D-ribose 1-methylphosphonate 5-triphosphate diphosphatase [Rhodobacteraceae bacterium]|jgi:alpha-D-ribose 1-methylphosphonate 5-triphosphate diphosphatase|nr:alpha-D-ribose 1-methylphosphonate 5-triphosphate diphosphatase [Paracoccaceae bacterium]